MVGVLESARRAHRSVEDDAGRGSRASYVESSEAGDATDVNRDGDEFVGEQFLQVQSPRLPSPPRVTV